MRGKPSNLAQNKPAWQISILFGGEASKAVDGGLSTYFYDKSCSHTGKAPAIWSVDLGKLADIYYVEVLNRGEGPGNYYLRILKKNIEYLE